MGSSWYKPKIIYESLPYIYVIAGLWTIHALDNWIAFGSGALLCAAGLSVWILRYSYRAREKEMREAAYRRGKLASREVAPRKELSLLVWRTSFSVGNELIDAQHLRLFSIGNAIINAVIGQEPVDILSEMLNDLVDNLEKHFTAEEQMMSIFENSVPDALKETHRTVLTRVRSIRDRFHNGSLDPAVMAELVVHNLIAPHITQNHFQMPRSIAADGYD